MRSCDLARKLGASLGVNARNVDPAAFIKKEVGGAHGVLVTAVSPKAFQQALGMVRRGGTVSLVGLPPGDFPLPIFDTVLNGITVRGSIVGTRLDLQEALQFAGEGKVKATVATEQAREHQRGLRAHARGRHPGPRRDRHALAAGYPSTPAECPFSSLAFGLSPVRQQRTGFFCRTRRAPRERPRRRLR